MEMPTRASEPVFLSRVLDSLWLVVEVWEQHRGQRPCFVLSLPWSGPVWSVGGFFSRKVAVTMMHWLTAELHRRFGNFRNALKICVTILVEYTMSRLEALSQFTWQISQRGSKGSGLAGCFSPPCFTASALLLSHPGGNTVGLHFQTW